MYALSANLKILALKESRLFVERQVKMLRSHNDR